VASRIVLYLGYYHRSLAHPRLTLSSSHRPESSMHFTAIIYLGNVEKVNRASTRGSPGTETSLVRSRADSPDGCPRRAVVNLASTQLVCSACSSLRACHLNQGVIWCLQHNGGLRLLLRLDHVPRWAAFFRKQRGEDLAMSALGPSGQDPRTSATWIRCDTRYVLSYASLNNIFGIPANTPRFVISVVA
jgi:hypothetical protein